MSFSMRSMSAKVATTNCNCTTKKHKDKEVAVSSIKVGSDFLHECTKSCSGKLLTELGMNS